MSKKSGYRYKPPQIDPVKAGVRRLKMGLKNEWVLLWGPALNKMTDDDRQSCLKRYNELRHSDFADEELIMICTKLIDRLTTSKQW